MISTWWGLALLAVAIAALAMVVTALVARAVGRVSVVDVTWGLALVAIGLGCAVAGHRYAVAPVAGVRAGGRLGLPPGVAHPAALARQG